MDALYKMFVEGVVCIVKMNPVHAWVGPYFREGFRAAHLARFHAGRLRRHATMGRASEREPPGHPESPSASQAPALILCRGYGVTVHGRSALPGPCRVGRCR